MLARVAQNVNLHAIRIRPYQSADADAVSRLIRATMLVSNSSDYPMERLQPLIDYFSPEKVEQINHERTCFVAEDSNSVVGTAGLEGNVLVTFFVAPAHQRRGIGAALLPEVESTARKAGLQRLEVQSSLAGAPFYEAMGYSRTGKIVEGTAGPHVDMSKMLA
jgi:GNAT superfamily N-acetyltransferase